MPGRLFLTQDTASIAAHFKVPIPDICDPARTNIAPGQEIIVLRQDRQLARMRWGIIPVGRVNARGRPVMETIINARSESVFEKTAFKGVQRCIVPVAGWYEWTGEKRKKTAWRISPRSGGLLAFAAICDMWTAPGGLTVEQVAILTCPPSADVKDIHDRMAVILDLQSVGVWLDGSQTEASELMVPLTAGLLKVEQAAEVDWTAP
jgi:putative SOS response-associated peptidase YedK